MPTYRVTIVKQVEWIYDIEAEGADTAEWQAEQSLDDEHRPPDKTRWLSTDCFVLGSD